MRHVEANLSPQIECMHGNGLDPVPEKRERMCLFTTGRGFARHAFFFFVARFLPVTSPSGLFGPFLRLVVEQLVLPAQILPDRGHSLIAQQFL